MITANPLAVCVGTSVNLNSLLTNAGSLSNISWYRGSVSPQTLISTPSNVSVSTTTTFFVRAESAEGCADTTSVVVTVRPQPNATVLVESASCTGGVVGNDAQLYVQNTSSTYRFDYTEGQTYGGTDTFATAMPIPSDGVLANNLANPATTTFYTVRIFDPNGCFQDYTVSLSSVNCACPQVCAPVSVRIIRR